MLGVNDLATPTTLCSITGACSFFGAAFFGAAFLACLAIVFNFGDCYESYSDPEPPELWCVPSISGLVSYRLTLNVGLNLL